jgi:ADP-heptose:LPS heptosyltransferase
MTDESNMAFSFTDFNTDNAKKACKYVLQYNIADTVLLGATQGIGNVIMATPLIKALTDLNLTVDLLNYGFNPGADEVLEDMANVRLVSEDVAADTSYLLGLQSVWPHCDVEKFAPQVRLCGNIQNVWKEGLPVHEVELNMSLAYSLKYDKEIPPLYCKYSVNEFRNKIDGRKHVGIHVCTRYHHQFYANRALHGPLLIARELEKQGFRPVIFGTEGVEANPDDWPVSTLFLTGMKLADTAGAIRQMDCMINEDSGIMHVTAAMDVRQVAIFGPTSPVKNRPWNKKAVVITKNLECQPCQYGPKSSTCYKNECMEIEADYIVDRVKRLIERFPE